MTGQDVIGLGVTYLYASALLGLAEAVRRWRSYPQDFTRKIVHVGAGMWVFGVLALFDTWSIGIIPFASFIVLNFLTYRYRLLAAVDDDESSPGTVYFALSITLLFLLLWRNSPADRSYVAAAGTMAMTWGDALASIIGRRWGRHRYTVRGNTRSWEGSAAMVIASIIAIFLTLWLVPGSALSPQSQPLGIGVCLAAALVGALAAALVEGVSPAGSDNLSVPLMAGLCVLGTTMLLA